MAIAHKLHSKEINHLRKKFQIIDTGNTGNNNFIRSILWTSLRILIIFLFSFSFKNFHKVQLIGVNLKNYQNHSVMVCFSKRVLHHRYPLNLTHREMTSCFMVTPFFFPSFCLLSSFFFSSQTTNNTRRWKIRSARIECDLWCSWCWWHRTNCIRWISCCYLRYLCVFTWGSFTWCV